MTAECVWPAGDWWFGFWMGFTDTGLLLGSVGLALVGALLLLRLRKAAAP